MNKLMQQIGKPYRWGGSSPRTGFDCSGLVYYAYKDLVKIRIPRTANEMYHLRDAAPIERSELKNGDLVFFRTQDAAQPIMSACMSATANLFSHRAQVRKFKSLLSVKTTGSATMLRSSGNDPKNTSLKLYPVVTATG
ncbi:putative exported hydrolase [Escherichia coli]|nr:putative exported hydrolase [Escherichia coli]